MADLPLNVDYGTVTGRFLIAYSDSDDLDLFPDGAAAKGSVFFTPSVSKLINLQAAPAPVTIVPNTVEAFLDTEGYLLGPDGTRGVRLIATDDPDMNPTNWTWQVNYRLTMPDDTPIQGIASHSISLPSASTVDLTLVAPVPSSNGTYYNVGPTGPTGPQANLSNVLAQSPIVFYYENEVFSFDWSATSIGDLGDVQIPSPTLIGNGDLLKYNPETLSWVNANMIDGGTA